MSRIYTVADVEAGRPTDTISLEQASRDASEIRKASRQKLVESRIADAAASQVEDDQDKLCAAAAVLQREPLFRHLGEQLQQVALNWDRLQPMNKEQE